MLGKMLLSPWPIRFMDKSKSCTHKNTIKLIFPARGPTDERRDELKFVHIFLLTCRFDFGSSEQQRRVSQQRALVVIKFVMTSNSDMLAPAARALPAE